MRDELRFELEKGPTVHVSTETVSEMLVKYIEYKAASGTVENSTIRDYHCSRRFLERYIGDVLVCKLTVDGVNGMMADAYICGTCEKDSKPYNPSLLTKEFSTFAKMNGFDCTFHDLRHSFATMMISKNVDIRTVASYLGCASPSMTLDVYADVDPDAKKAAVDKIDGEYNDVLAKSPTELIASEMMPQNSALTPLPYVSASPKSKDQSPADHAMASLMSLDVRNTDPSMIQMLLELAQGKPVA